jgi:prepilin-type N-terminal cleavage/methylation domain-containing protein
VRRLNAIGFTLIELLAAIGIFAMIGAAATALLTASLDAQNQGDSRSGLYWDGTMLMERMTSELRQCTFLLVPNAHKETRDILVFSRNVNEDDDYYFDDPLFPRCDEDMEKDMTLDLLSGVAGIDDNGDGFIDDLGDKDDDEDTFGEEDWLDGVDNDGDGNIDEDLGVDNSKDGMSGIAGMDDDGDGLVDEGHIKNDDEDDSEEEDWVNPVIYSWESATNTLVRILPGGGSTSDLSTRVIFFQVTYEAPGRVLISLTLTGDDSKNVAFSEYVHLENTFQRLGKRVR